jgi:hypothetical protein
MRETAEGCSNYEFLKYCYRPLVEDDSDEGKKISCALMLKHSLFYLII